jgi:hypothetical protein
MALRHADNHDPASIHLHSQVVERRNIFHWEERLFPWLGPVPYPSRGLPPMPVGSVNEFQRGGAGVVSSDTIGHGQACCDSKADREVWRRWYGFSLGSFGREAPARSLTATLRATQYRTGANLPD